jgi:aminoglycoside phosphotransferase (APT) family kinase protein
MPTTPRQVIDSVVRSVCRREVERLVRLTSGGMNETYRVELAAGGSVIARVGRQSVPWFADEAHIMAQARAVGVPTAEVLGVERGAAFLRRELAARPAPSQVLVHGDWMPKHLLIDDGVIAGLIDGEFAGPASPAYDFAMWEVDAGDGLCDRSDLLRRGYARVADPDAADAGWVPAFVVAWALEVLGWGTPASPERIRRCMDVIGHYVDA